MSRVYNKNEKSDRNRMIFDSYSKGAQLIDISKEYGLSIPRIHRIIMQEENKILRKENSELKEILGKEE